MKSEGLLDSSHTSFGHIHLLRRTWRAGIKGILPHYFQAPLDSAPCLSNENILEWSLVPFPFKKTFQEQKNMVTLDSEGVQHLYWPTTYPIFLVAVNGPVFSPCLFTSFSAWSLDRTSPPVGPSALSKTRQADARHTSQVLTHHMESCPKKTMAQGFTVVWCTGKHIQSSLAAQTSAVDRMVYVGWELVQEFFQNWL